MGPGVDVGAMRRVGTGVGRLVGAGVAVGLGLGASVGRLVGVGVAVGFGLGAGVGRVTGFGVAEEIGAIAGVVVGWVVVAGAELGDGGGIGAMVTAAGALVGVTVVAFLAADDVGAGLGDLVAAGVTSGRVVETSPHADKTKTAAKITKVAAARIRPMEYILATRRPKVEPVLSPAAQIRKVNQEGCPNPARLGSVTGAGIASTF